MFGNLLKRSRFSSKPTDLDLLAGISVTIGKLEKVELDFTTEQDTGIPIRTKILEIAKQDPLKTSALIHIWLHDH